MMTFALNTISLLVDYDNDFRAVDDGNIIWNFDG